MGRIVRDAPFAVCGNSMYDLHFDHDDLWANRAGHLTPQQRERVAVEGQAHLINVTNEWRSRYSRYELHLRRHGLNRTVMRFSSPNALRHF